MAPISSWFLTGHYLNRPRQAIQCHADLTPMEWQLVRNKVRYFHHLCTVNTTHLLENFEAVYSWALREYGF